MFSLERYVVILRMLFKGKNAAELALVMCSTIDRFESNHIPRFLTGECGTISALNFHMIHTDFSELLLRSNQQKLSFSLIRHESIFVHPHPYHSNTTLHSSDSIRLTILICWAKRYIELVVIRVAVDCRQEVLDNTQLV